MSTSFRKGACLLLITALLVACGGHDESSDPFDEAAIKRDFEVRSLNVIHEEFDKASWTPPVSGVITESQIVSFVQMSKLAARIVEVSNHDFDEKAEEASREKDRFSRAVSQISAISNVRNVATAQIRASLRLGFNPREMDWLANVISRTAQIIAERRTDEKQGRSPQQRTATQKANSELVERHATELSPYIRALRAP